LFGGVPPGEIKQKRFNMSKEIDILYVHPTKLLSNTEYCFIPLGLIGLLNLLRHKGYTTLGINYGIEKYLDNNYQLEHDITDIDYNVLLIDLHWFEHSYGAIQVAKIARALHPEKPVVLGGITATIYSEEILEAFPVIDYIIRGDGENPLLLLMDYLLKNQGCPELIPNLGYRDGKDIVSKSLTYLNNDFEELDCISVDFLRNKRFFYYLHKSSIDLKMKSATLNMARGCRYDCSFCSAANRNSGIFYGRANRFTYKTVQAVAMDIERLVQKKVKLFYPSHGFEMFPENYYRELFSILRAKKFEMGMSIPCCQLPPRKILIDMKNTFVPGLTQIILAPYTGDESVRKLNGRQFSNKELFELLEFMAREEIQVRLLYAQNVNYEKPDSFDLTLEQIERIAGFYPGQLLTVVCERIYLDPLAPYRDHIDSTLNTFKDCYDYCKNNDKNDLGYADGIPRNLDDRLNRFDSLRERLNLHE
jgi:radical SAM superfamily enzyme YgiQ (UPF0313 family)